MTDEQLKELLTELKPHERSTLQKVLDGQNSNRCHPFGHLGADRGSVDDRIMKVQKESGGTRIDLTGFTTRRHDPQLFRLIALWSTTTAVIITVHVS